MAVPGAGWSIVWGPERDYAYVVDPDGGIIWRWFGDDNELSTITLAELQNTEAIINQTNPPAAGGGGGPGVTEEAGGGYSVYNPWTGLVEVFETWAEADAAFWEWQQQMQEQADADAEAEYQRRLEEDRAYNEARALASQHAAQQEAWGWAVANAPGAGANILSNRLPAYLPNTVAGSLLKYGTEMGADYAPPWPGGTELNVAQMVPKGQDWVDWLIGQGYPGYLLR